MSKKSIVLVMVFASGFLYPVADVAWAENARVLPKGISRVGVKAQYYFTIDERYDPDGHAEDVAADFNATLDETVFPALAAFGPGSSIGDSIVTSEIDATTFDFSFEHGVTNRLTLGIKVPYWILKNTVTARLDSSPSSSANIGTIPVAPYLFPIASGGTPLTTDQAQDLLGAGLDANGDGMVDIPGFGYDRVETIKQKGITDIEVGGRYQYHRSEDWLLAFTGAVRLPTGEVDDPDNLMDTEFGEGAYALLFNFNHDYIGLENWVFNGTLIYEWVLPAKETLRVPDDVNLPITTNKEKVDRDIGDVYGIDLSANRSLTEALSLGARYRYKARTKDDVSGNMGFAYQSLEEETDWTQHEYFVGVSYSTLARYMRTRSGVPMLATLSYRNRFKGTNNLLKSQYVGLELRVFF